MRIIQRRQRRHLVAISRPKPPSTGSGTSTASTSPTSDVDYSTSNGGDIDGAIRVALIATSDEMAAFDELPPRVRSALNRALYPLAAHEVRDVLRRTSLDRDDDDDDVFGRQPSPDSIGVKIVHNSDAAVHASLVRERVILPMPMPHPLPDRVQRRRRLR
jgi:Family of unknown function (DUF6525)